MYVGHTHTCVFTFQAVCFWGRWQGQIMCSEQHPKTIFCSEEQSPNISRLRVTTRVDKCRTQLWDSLKDHKLCRDARFKRIEYVAGSCNLHYGSSSAKSQSAQVPVNSRSEQAFCFNCMPQRWKWFLSVRKTISKSRRSGTATKESRGRQRKGYQVDLLNHKLSGARWNRSSLKLFRRKAVTIDAQINSATLEFLDTL